MFGVWCEYDIGQENLIFETENVAWSWLEVTWNELVEDEPYDKEDGLCNVIPLTLIKEV